jgi:hypothetical protein
MKNRRKIMKKAAAKRSLRKLYRRNEFLRQLVKDLKLRRIGSQLRPLKRLIYLRRMSKLKKILLARKDSGVGQRV